MADNNEFQEVDLQDLFKIKKFESEDFQDSPVVFFCKDCKETFPVASQGKFSKMLCPKCKSRKVALGTERAVKNFFHLS